MKCDECDGRGCFYCEKELFFDAKELLKLCPELDGHRLIEVIGPHLPTEWTMANRRAIYIRDMSDKHLTNAVKMLVRHSAVLRAKHTGDQLGMMSSEMFGPRGDGAQMACEAAANELLEDTWIHHASPHFWAMLAEFRRRKLDFDVVDYGKKMDALAIAIEVNAYREVADADKLLRIKKILKE